MNNFTQLASSFKSIILINDSNYIGDSVIFFWPVVNLISCNLSSKKIEVFHNHQNIFKPLKAEVSSFNLESFYELDIDKKNTLIVAFTLKKGSLKHFLKKKGFQSIVKDFVGINFIALNFFKLINFNKDLNCISIDDFEIHYIPKIQSFFSNTGFPNLNGFHENVYEYSKICNESFFGLNEMDIACKENIIINEVNNQETFADLFDAPSPTQDRKYILINLICGTFKEEVQENSSYMLNWIKEIVTTAKKEDIDVWLLVDNKFPIHRIDLHQYATNLFYLKEHSSLYWTSFIKKADQVYSIVTGFLHIAHILNKNTVGFGGDVDFWFFKDKIVNYLDSNDRK